MAITGQLLCAFVVVHLAGNLSLFAGAKAFNHYAEFLEGLGATIYFAEAGLVALCLLHLLSALKLTLENWHAKPTGYHGGSMNTPNHWASSTMPYTGTLIIIFIIMHLLDFKFAARPNDGLYGLVKGELSTLPGAATYLFFMIVLGIHLFHAFQSAFLSLGLDHPKYTPWIRRVGYVYAVSMVLGFSAITLFFGCQ
jgi:succinate dehydrogenase / fumarate reductase cytochrome b subunit